MSALTFFAAAAMLLAVESGPETKPAKTSICVQGGKALEAKQYQKASDLLDACLLKEKPTGNLRLYALLNRAGARLNLAKFDAAIADYDAALAGNPSDVMFARAYVDRGFALWSVGKHERALADVERAKSLGMNTPNTRFVRGAALLSLGRTKESLVEFDAAVAGGKKDALLLILRASALGELKRFKEAVAQLDIILATHPNALAALINRSTAYEQLNELDKALADIDKANKLAPNKPDILNNRCYILARMHRGAEALKDCERMMELLRGEASAGALHSLAVAQAEAGKKQDAAATFKKALSKAGKDPGTRAIIERDMKRYAK